MEWTQTVSLPRRNPYRWMPSIESEKFLCAFELQNTDYGEVLYLIICPKDQEHVVSWEELQAIKDDLVPQAQAVEVYPPKGEVMNTANMRHLFCFLEFKLDLRI